MGPEALRVAGLSAALESRPRGPRSRQSQRSGAIPAAAAATATGTCAEVDALEPAGARRGAWANCRRPAADSARRRSQPRASARSAPSRATAADGARRCACCGSMHMRTSTPACCRRAATCTACRSRACAASVRASSLEHRRPVPAIQPADDPPDRHPQRRCGREALRARAGARSVRHALHRRDGHAPARWNWRSRASMPTRICT